jgi:hypothetical protein
VFVDGEPRGVTPLTIELPRGPHSLRVQWRGEDTPPQVIELPGGNRRFASFAFGLDAAPELRLQAAMPVLVSGRVQTVSATIEDLVPSEVREAWLHVRSGDGLWRRVAMQVQPWPTGTVVSVAFPEAVFDDKGRTQWYLSVTTPQGDEYVTEMQRTTRR